MNNFNSPTKDEILLMPNKIDSILNRLGFNLCLRGYIYYRDLILFSLNFNLDEIRLIDLYSLISQKYNKPCSIIKKNIENIFNSLSKQSTKSWITYIDKAQELLYDIIDSLKRK